MIYKSLSKDAYLKSFIQPAFITKIYDRAICFKDSLWLSYGEFYKGTNINNLI